MLKVQDSAGNYMTDDEIVRLALTVIEHRFEGKRKSVNSPSAVKDDLRLALPTLEHEVFCLAFLDAQNRVIAFEELFRGTLTQTSVYPREVVKRALHRNAAALILAHNHPSGSPEPSRVDKLITQALKQACNLVDVRIMDHIIIAGSLLTSFAEKGLL